MSHSLRALLPLLVLLAAAPVHADEVRLLVSIAAHVGDPEDAPLRYAGQDAERMRRVMVELGGLSPDRAYLVVDQPAHVVRQRLAEVTGRVAELRAAGRDVVLMVYVSAHARAGTLHLMGTHLPLEELRSFAEGSGARLRILVLDACDSGAIARQKGGTPGPAYAVQLEKLPLRGQVIMTSSGPAQASEEWDELRGSLFTHHLLTGLRGDADAEGDGKVTLGEAYGYAYRRTVASSARDGQHPSYDFDLSGTGELVLTEPRKAQSALLFPAQMEGRFVVHSIPRANVVAEVEKVAGRPLRLAVPAGRYVVRKRKGRSAGLTEVEIPFGGERQIQDRELVWRDFTEVALKGGSLELRPWSVLLGGAVQTAAVEGTGARWLPQVAVRRTQGAWWGTASLGGTQAGYRGVRLDITERSMALGLSAGYRWLSWPVIPHVGLGLELAGMEQSFLRDREEELRRVGHGPLAKQRAVSPAVGLVVGAEVPLPGPMFSLVQVRAGGRHLEVTNAGVSRQLHPDVQGSVQVGMKF